MQILTSSWSGGALGKKHGVNRNEKSRNRTKHRCYLLHHLIKIKVCVCVCVWYEVGVVWREAKKVTLDSALHTLSYLMLIVTLDYFPPFMDSEPETER